MALPQVGDGEQIGDGNTNETLNVGRSGQTVQIGGTAATLVGFHGKTPTSQASFVATQSFNVIYGSVSASAFVGFSSSGAFSNFVSLVNAMQAVLVNKGFMAAS